MSLARFSVVEMCFAWLLTALFRLWKISTVTSHLMYGFRTEVPWHREENYFPSSPCEQYDTNRGSQLLCEPRRGLTIKPVGAVDKIKAKIYLMARCVVLPIYVHVHQWKRI